MCCGIYRFRLRITWTRLSIWRRIFGLFPLELVNHILLKSYRAIFVSHLTLYWGNENEINWQFLVDLGVNLLIIGFWKTHKICQSFAKTARLCPNWQIISRKLISNFHVFTGSRKLRQNFAIYGESWEGERENFMFFLFLYRIATQKRAALIETLVNR